MAKRWFDVIVGGALALLALPLIVVCAITLTVLLRAQPFFVQRRVGRDGREFSIIKLRTLRPGTAPSAAKSALGSVTIPSVAARLRRRHLDELPQLFLVVLGRMSLVGPRPEMPDLHARFEPTFAQRRTGVRPGCTGLWQIGPDRDGLIAEAPGWDEFYLDNRCLQMDLWILGRTVGVLTGHDRSLRLGEVPRRAVRRSARAETAGLSLAD